MQYGSGIKKGVKAKNGDSKMHPDNFGRKSSGDSPTTCCFCIKTNKAKRKGLLTGLVTNIGIFALLLAYTLLGSFVFLAIEGGAAKMHQKTLATTIYQQQVKEKSTNSVQTGPNNANNSSASQASADLRAKTVENIWEITVSLNILYKENWTRLAAQEIGRFQEQLVQKVAAELAGNAPPAGKALETAGISTQSDEFEWNFAKAFLYSLTVLTTIGYGSIAPRTALGKAVTMGYAVLGIPLTLLYLSVVGTLLSRLARSVFSRALCCCLCTNCGYCCYDENRMADKERKKKLHRQHMEHTTHQLMQEPYYVRSPSGTIISAAQAHRNQTISPTKEKQASFLRDCDSLSCGDTDSKLSFKGLSILAPVLLCLIMIASYIFMGGFILYKIENWKLLDGIYFCFMSLSTIGFGDLVPGSSPHYRKRESNGTIWFCSIYIISGLALTAMCFNVLHDEIVHRLKHQERALRASVQRALKQDLTNRQIS